MEAAKPEILYVALKAFIVHAGKVLILREAARYVDRQSECDTCYDLPGGRLNLGESYAQALLREVREETGLEVELGDAFHIDEWRPVIRGTPVQIVGTFLKCESRTSVVQLSDDHDVFEWISPERYLDYGLHPGTKRAFERYLRRGRDSWGHP